MQRAPRTTARVARNRDPPESAWSDDHVLAWKAVQDLVVHAFTLYHLRPDSAVSVVPDESHAYLRWFPHCVSQCEYQCDIPIGNMTHQPSTFLSGMFESWKLRLATVDKEGFAVVSSFRRFDHLVSNDLQVPTDHRNLTRIFYSRSMFRRFQKPLPNAWRSGEQNTWANEVEYGTTGEHARVGESDCTGFL